MKRFSRSAKISLFALSISLVSLSISTPATAAPVSQEDYVSFSTSVRNRAKGEKRFKGALELVYGNQDVLKSYFGSRGPTPKLRLFLKSKKGTITFRGNANENVSVEEVNLVARPGRNILVMLVNNALCQVGQEAPETCEAEIRVIKGRTSISERIIASGSNGAEYDSGSLDVQAGGLVLSGDLPQ
jgi:hypothetical protein